MIKLRWLVAIAASLLMTSCKPKTIIPDCSPLSDNSEIAQKSNSITTLIQIDGTPSMQGFTKNFTNSRYAQTLDLLDRASTTTWKNSIVQYFRFGTINQPIDRQTYLQAKLPEFYGGGNPVFKVSQIERAIALPAKDRISIIVTDLYQKDSDTNLVLKKLKEDYLQKGYAVGILAIRSEFDGIIYDVGIKNTQFAYNTQGKKLEQFRPFYVLVLGSYGNIFNYFNEIKKTSDSLIKDEQFTIFYPQVVRQASTFQPENLPELPKGIRRLKTINDGKVLVKVNKQPIEIININKTTEDDYSINYQAPYYPLPYTLPIDAGAVAVSSVAQAFDTVAKDFQPLNGAKALQISDWKTTKNNLSFNTKINSNNLEPGVYLFTIDALPQNLKDWEWWQKWNSSESSFDGAKTNNLLPFFQGLKSITTELITINKSSIGRFCYAIKKN